ncbi:MAG: multidrug transporter [Clostridia bacterium]|nr:multidrug transporter [Clostridia bacterium]
MFYKTTTKDWNLFREKLPNWQEEFIKKLNNEYIHILNDAKHASEIFWELEKRINTDKSKAGVRCEMRKSIMVDNIVSLLKEGVIKIDDLSDFSEELKEYISFLINVR